MKSKKEQIKAKGKDVKAKLVAKLKGAAKAGAACLLLASLCGCQQLIPATRSNSTRYEELVRIEAGGHVSTINITIGDGTLASADGGGDSQSNTPTQTISPTTQLSYGIGTGGGSTWGELFSGMSSLFGKAAASTATATPSAASASAAGNCADGSCATPATAK